MNSSEINVDRLTMKEQKMSSENVSFNCANGYGKLNRAQEIAEFAKGIGKE